MNISQFQNWPSNTYFCRSLLPALENCIFLGCSSEGSFASSFHCERCRIYSTQSQITRDCLEDILLLLEVSRESCVLLHYIAELRVSPERLPCCIFPVIKLILLTSYLSLQVDLRPLIDLDRGLRGLIDEDTASAYRRDLGRERDFLDLRTLVEDTKEGSFLSKSSLISIDLRENRSTFCIINPNLKDKIVRIESLLDCHVSERLYTYPVSKHSFLFTRKAYSIFIATLWESLSECCMDTEITINIIATLWIDLDRLHHIRIRFDRISKEVFLTYRLF